MIWAHRTGGSGKGKVAAVWFRDGGSRGRGCVRGAAGRRPVVRLPSDLAPLVLASYALPVDTTKQSATTVMYSDCTKMLPHVAQQCKVIEKECKTPLPSCACSAPFIPLLPTLIFVLWGGGKELDIETTKTHRVVFRPPPTSET